MLAPGEAWPPNYAAIYAQRQRMLLSVREGQRTVEQFRAYYSDRPVEFVQHHVDTYDPRNAGRDKLARMPLVPFKRQREFIQFLAELLRAEAHGIVEKSRDMGATWSAVGVSVWAWLLVPGIAIGWGSRKEMLVDQKGDPDSIFEKMRMVLRGLPKEYLPRGFSFEKHCAHMRIVNPETGATITGEAGDNIGRGGRKRIYFKDESAHYEHPESIEASLGDNTRVQVDISSVNGTGNVFYRRRKVAIDWEPGTTMEAGRTYAFVMDWRDHPEKTQTWYEQRHQKAIDDGLEHIFYQEVDRNYAASVEGIIIRPEWAAAAVGAAERLGFDDSGRWLSALDVADEGGDVNAQATRKGVVLKRLEQWGARDTGETARRAVTSVADLGPLDMMYDCVGVGAGVKAETNRLRTEKLMPAGLVLVPWNGGDEILHKGKRVIPGDKQSPLNEDFYANLKAQGWWQLGRRFERTWRAIRKLEGDPNQQSFTWDADDLISIDPQLPLLRQLIDELSQPVMTKSARLKLLVDKKPDGTRSPNLADAAMMCYWPIPSGRLEISAGLLQRAAMPGPGRRFGAPR